MQKIHLLIVFIFILTNSYTYSQNHNTLAFIGEYEIPNNTEFKQTIIGGLSGIEYFSDNIYYLISDDFGEHGNPRMYKTQISYDEKGIQSLNILDVKFLMPPVGSHFVTSHSEKSNNIALYCDAEAIRYDKSSNEFIWSSEGYGNEICAQPFIFYSDTNGIYKKTFLKDPLFSFDCSEKKGLQHNAVFEALSFVPQTNMLVYCTEKSLLQDVSSQKNAVNPVRITFANKISKKNSVQYVYMLDDVFENNSNGITDILAVSRDTLLVLERAFDKTQGGKIQLYRCTIDNATEVQSFDQLKSNKYIPLKKELLMDFSKMELKHIDNMEGMCWGHPINGKPTLLFVSDNNFNFFQITQLLLFEYNTR